MQTGRLYLLLTIMTLLSLSCKKDDDTEIPSLNGSLKISGLETFVEADMNGTEIVLKAGGNVSHPDGGSVGYYWKVSPLMDKYDTTLFVDGTKKPGSDDGKTFRYTIKDTLGTFTVYCYAYATGYSGLSKSGYITTVRGGVETGNGQEVSITKTGIASRGTQLAGTGYYYTRIDGKDWIMNNLYEDETGDGESAMVAGIGLWDYDVMSSVFGRYYNYEDAKAVCASLPAGNGNQWRLPSDEDWVDMVKSITMNNDKASSYLSTLPANSNIIWDTEAFGRPTVASVMMADADFNYLKLWEYWPGPGEITNTSGLSMIPTGYANIPAEEFYGVYDYAAFWTSTEDSEDTDMAYYRFIYTKDPHFMIARGNKETFGAAVRCVRESL